MIVINGFKNEITIEQAPAVDQVFELENILVDQFLGRGYSKKDIVFLTTGIGAAKTTYGCINSHYYDLTKPVNGTRGIFRTKQAGRTGLGSVMSDKKVRAVVILAEYPQGENPYGAQDWEKVKKAGARLHKVVKEVDPQSLKMHRKGSAGLITFMNKEEYQSLPVNNFQVGSDPRAGQICGKNYAEHLFEHRGMDGCFPGCNLQCTKGGLGNPDLRRTPGAGLGRRPGIRDRRRLRLQPGNLERRIHHGSQLALRQLRHRYDHHGRHHGLYHGMFSARLSDPRGYRRVCADLGR